MVRQLVVAEGRGSFLLGLNSSKSNISPKETDGILVIQGGNSAFETLGAPWLPAKRHWRPRQDSNLQPSA